MPYKSYYQIYMHHRKIETQVVVWIYQVYSNLTLECTARQLTQSLDNNLFFRSFPILSYLSVGSQSFKIWHTQCIKSVWTVYKQASHSKSQLMAMHCVQTFCKSEISELGFCHIILTLLLESVKFTDISDILKELKCYACFQLPTASYIDWLTSSDSSLLVSSSSSDFCKIDIFFSN